MVKKKLEKEFPFQEKSGSQCRAIRQNFGTKVTMDDFFIKKKDFSGNLNSSGA